MKTISSIARFTLLVMLFMPPYASNAAVWKAIGGGPAGFENLSFGGSFFYDGQYNERSSTLKLDEHVLTSPISSTGFSTYSFYQEGDVTSPPNVDLDNQIIDLSSLMLTGWTSDTNNPENFYTIIGYELGIGYDSNGNFVAMTDVPFSQNADGTYTATWVTPASLNGVSSGGSTYSFTFELVSGDPSFSVSPPDGTLLSTQNFDLGLLIKDGENNPALTKGFPVRLSTG